LVQNDAIAAQFAAILTQVPVATVVETTEALVVETVAVVTLVTVVVEETEDDGQRWHVRGHVVVNRSNVAGFAHRSLIALQLTPLISEHVPPPIFGQSAHVAGQYSCMKL